MTANFALLWVERAFTDKYTRKEYKSGQVAVFERERAIEIMAVLGEKGVRELTPPEGYKLVPIETGGNDDVEVSKNATEETPTADSEKPNGKSGAKKGATKSGETKK